MKHDLEMLMFREHAIFSGGSIYQRSETQRVRENQRKIG
jgi:hypothetical protein